VRLWTGETVSVFGSLIGYLALQFTAVLWLHSSALALALLGACSFAPGFVVGLFAGVWVDRLNRRPILIAADLGRFAILATIPVAAVFDVLTFAHLCAAALAAATLTTFFEIAYEAYLPTLIERDELVEGNAKLTASASVAEFGSFSVAGWLVQLIKGPGAILVDAISFLVSALCIWRIRTPEPPPAPAHERQHIAREALEGMSLVWRTPVLRAFAGANVLLMMSSRIISVAFLLYLVDDVGFGPGVLGMIFAVGGVTSLAGAYLAGRPQWFGGFGPALVISLIVRGVGALFMPLAGSVSLVGASLLVGNQIITDPAWSFYEINMVSLRQTITPDRLQGRMNASMRFIDFGAMLVGTALGGVIGELYGPRQALIVAACGMFAAAGYLALTPVARLRAMPAAEGGDVDVEFAVAGGR
jgi:MFS family permease